MKVLKSRRITVPWPKKIKIMAPILIVEKRGFQSLREAGESGLICAGGAAHSGVHLFMTPRKVVVWLLAWIGSLGMWLPANKGQVNYH